MMKHILIILTLFIFSCSGINQKDVQYTWDMMCDEYKVKNRAIPKIVYIDEYRENCQGYPIYGIYTVQLYQVILFKGFGYSTLIHEFHHALGNDLGEYILPFPTRRY